MTSIMSEESMPMEFLVGHGFNDTEKKFCPDKIYTKGDTDIALLRPKVSVIGVRKASPEGLEYARDITKKLVAKHVVIVSGLAEGIDTVAHETAMNNGGKTIAVIGTPLNKTFPAKNFKLQQKIMKNHLVITQFANNHPILPQNFIMRNKIMALISDASIIVEAGKTSGTIHQGWEGLRLGRLVFLTKNVINNCKSEWADEMMKYGAIELDELDDIFQVLPSDIKMSKLFE
ncbi:MAG: DNA-processing protein DprA [Candidatus Nitrosoabyssus spongiisocia]|nr:MAG: DNA-processing protein DprA [Nitrosopumilaceae archaeon AB1(1)]